MNYTELLARLRAKAETSRDNKELYTAAADKIAELQPIADKAQYLWEQHDRLLTEMEKAMDEIETLKNAVEKKKGELNQLLEDNRELLKLNEGAAQELAKIDEENARLKSDLHDFIEEYDKKTAELKDAYIENAKLREEVENLKAYRQELLDTLDERTSELKGEETKNTKLLDENAKLRIENDRLNHPEKWTDVTGQLGLEPNALNSKPIFPQSEINRSESVTARFYFHRGQKGYGVSFFLADDYNSATVIEDADAVFVKEIAHYSLDNGATITEQFASDLLDQAIETRKELDRTAPTPHHCASCANYHFDTIEGGSCIEHGVPVRETEWCPAWKKGAEQ